MHAVYGNALFCLVTHTGGTVVAMRNLRTLLKSLNTLFRKIVIPCEVNMLAIPVFHYMEVCVYQPITPIYT